MKKDKDKTMAHWRLARYQGDWMMYRHHKERQNLSEVGWTKTNTSLCYEIYNPQKHNIKNRDNRLSNLTKITYDYFDQLKIDNIDIMIHINPVSLNLFYIINNSYYLDLLDLDI